MPATQPAPSQDTGRRALVVVGMHRSGTSAMARLLSLAGADLPPELVGAGTDNPLGFWEPAQMVALNDEMMASVGSRWDDIFNFEVARRLDATPFKARAEAFAGATVGSLPVFKDPRASVLISVWIEALRRHDITPLFIVMVRHPLEVAASLHARSRMPREQALMLWLSHMVAVERDTRGTARLFVDYADVLGDWRGVLARVQTALGSPLPGRSAEAEAGIDAFLSSAHRHHVAATDEMDGKGAWSGLIEAHGWMQAAAQDRPPDPAVMDRIERDLQHLERHVGPALNHAHREAALYPITRFRLGEAEQEIEALRTLCNRFHAEGDLAQQAATAAEQLAARVMGERDAALAEIGRHEVDLLMERARTRASIAHDQARADAVTRERDDLARQADDAARHALDLQARIEAAHDFATDLQQRLDQAGNDATAQSQALAEADSEHEVARAEVEALRDALQRAERDLADNRAEHGTLSARLAAVETDRAALRNSRSWRLTRPLRRLGKGKREAK